MCTTSPEKVDINVIVSLFKQTLKFQKPKYSKIFDRIYGRKKGQIRKNYLKPKALLSSCFFLRQKGFKAIQIFIIRTKMSMYKNVVK